jgi:hypothetical protein
MRIDHLRREYVLSVLRESGPMNVHELGSKTGLDGPPLHRALTLLADEDEITVGDEWMLSVVNDD